MLTVLQSFFGFGPSLDIELVLDGQDTRKTAEIKAEDGKIETHYLYYDGETIGGKVYCLLFVLFITWCSVVFKEPKFAVASTGTVPCSNKEF